MKSIICFIIFIILLLQSGGWAGIFVDNAQTIFNNSDLKDFNLSQSTKTTNTWNELTIPKYYPGIDFRKMKSKTVVFFDESWISTKDHKENININVKRIQLESTQAAREWVKMDVFDFGLKEGSFTGKSFGDKCWYACNTSETKHGVYTTYVLHFIKGNIIARITILNRGKIGSDYIEKLAEIVESRL
jgi:hypothetical protein